MKIYALGVLFLSLPMVMNGQDTSDNYSFKSHGFFQVQGGLHLPFTSGNRSKLIQPNFGVGLGGWFSPALGARINAEGLNSKVRYADKYQSFHYLTIGVDAMLNLSPLFVQNNNPRNNLYLVGGIGVTRRGKQKFEDIHNESKLIHNFRVGVGYEYRIAKPLSLSLEYRLNSADDKFDVYLNNKDDWHSSLLVGVAYNFAYAKKPYATPIEPRTKVSTGDYLTLYEQAQQEIDKRMGIWMQRMQGESKDEFRLRTNPQALEAQRLTYANAVYKEFAEKTNHTLGERLTAANVSLARQTMKLDFDAMPSLTFPITLEQARALTQAYGSDYKKWPFERDSTKYKLRPDDTFEITHARLILPTNEKIDSYNPYDNLSQLKNLEGESLLTIADIHKDLQNQEILEKIRNKALEAFDKNYTLDNTTIQVGTEPMPTTAGLDYKVKYVYQANEGFSVKNDFAPGRYEADRSVASRAMLSIITQSLADPTFAKFLRDGKELHINYSGSADAKPVRNPIAYNGRYGDIKEQVKVNGKTQTLSVTKAEGIKSNEELSLVRAKSVRDYIHTNIPAIDKMKVIEDYNVNVSENEGSEYRRVAVELIFRNVHDAFK